jgi:hypothetical protein
MAIRGHNRKTLLCMSVYLLSAVAGPATAAPAAQSGAGLLRGVASVRKVGSAPGEFYHRYYLSRSFAHANMHG